MSDNKLVRGNYHVFKIQKKVIKKIAKELNVSESEVVRIALNKYILSTK